MFPWGKKEKQPEEPKVTAPAGSVTVTNPLKHSQSARPPSTSGTTEHASAAQTAASAPAPMPAPVGAGAAFPSAGVQVEYDDSLFQQLLVRSFMKVYISDVSC